VLLDGARFSKSGPGSAGFLITQVMGTRALFNQDGEEHRLVRHRLADLFASRCIDTLASRVVGPAVERLLCDYRRGREIDLVDFAHGLTGRFIAALLGLPEHSENDAYYHSLFEQGARLVRSMGISTTVLRGDQLSVARKRFLEMTGPMNHAWEAPGDSIVRRLREVGYEREEARGVVGMLILAGTETVSTALPRMVALLVDTGEWARLQADQSLMPRALDEALRVIAPTPVMLRAATADVDVANFRFRAGERVVILTYNLLKDRRELPDWRYFRVDRSQPQGLYNLAFGAGPHFCLGHNLAKRELEEPLRAMLSESGTPRIVRRTPAMRVLIPAYRSLVVRHDA
jgi:cytochrome P450